ncbi:B12-binding domain-containing radical SAM protein [Wukongibacter sp. M2B1]|uniref:B12-binding domain-containing radical SAM protein n=1 Tax=Wukongibacter sp. M2B1 TaxID=3088895 RepID=UPI003D7AA174
MKILLTTLNSKFIHSSLSLRYLRNYTKDKFPDVHIEEYTVNNDLDYILRELYLEDYDLICFGCYIWNIDQTLEIAKNLKKVNRNIKILLGGPEVSYNPRAVLKEHNYIDYIIFGEGEVTIEQLFDFLVNKRGNIKKIEGLAFRDENDIYKNEERALIKNLDDIPFPYGDLAELENRIIYYESSRGCPFNCQYCLSSTLQGVRYFSIERIKKDLRKFVDADVKQVKFVDRTFNADKHHCLEIMKYIEEIDNGKINFHFEITASLIDDKILNYLKDTRRGLFQFEVGVQSTYEKTLKEIRRHMNFEKIKYVIEELTSYNNIHLHLDLIAGLPYEDYKTFLLSFDDVYSLKPNKIQLGFLKLLKGSGLRKNCEKYGYVYKDKSPYEVMSNNYITYGEMLRLKLIEEMVDEYYNSHHFDFSVEFIIVNNFDRPSSFFESLYEFWISEGYHHVSHKKEELYRILLKFYIQNNFDREDEFKEVLKFDYLRNKRGNLPRIFDSIILEDFKNRCHKFLQEEENLERYLPKFIGIPAKRIINKTHFETFKYDILQLIIDLTKKALREETTILFDYEVENKDFGRSRYMKIEI